MFASFPPFAGLVTFAERSDPIPSRTRPSNASAPMVLCLKTWESRSPPGLPRANNDASPAIRDQTCLITDPRWREHEANWAFAENREPTTEDRQGCASSLFRGPSSVFCFAHSEARALINESDQAERAISTGQLHALLRFHTRPINVVVFHGSSGRTRFEVGFRLRCLQRLSRPYIATLQCGWRHNRSTRGTSIPVLSY